MTKPKVEAARERRISHAQIHLPVAVNPDDTDTDNISDFFRIRGNAKTVPFISYLNLNANKARSIE